MTRVGGGFMAGQYLGGTTTKTTLSGVEMRTLFRWLSGVLFILAMGAIAMLLVVDATNHLTLAAAHQQAGALAFMLIGASYISLQLSSGRRLNEMIKQLLLGL